MINLDNLYWQLLQSKQKPPNRLELALFDKWLEDNKIRDYDYGIPDYDLLSAFRSGLMRDNKSGHWSDLFKLPTHPTFSTESQYYRKGMPAIQWTGKDNEYLPAGVEPDWTKLRFSQ